MKYEIEGRRYEFDGEYTVAEAMLIFDKVGVGVAEIPDALRRGNPYMLNAMMHVIKRRAGEAVRWEDTQGLSLAAFKFIPDEPADDASADDNAANRTAPDPTGGSGEIHEPDTATTS